MNIRKIALGVAIVASTAFPALAQTHPTSNATQLGSEGPNSNSAGYPSAANQGGTITTTQVGPRTLAARHVKTPTRPVKPVG